MLRETISSHIVFSPTVNPQREGDIAYFASACPKERVPISSDEAELSLREFSETMSGDKLNEFMAQYRKKSALRDSYDFSLSYVFGKGVWTVGAQGFGEFYMDSERGIALGVRNPGDTKTLWVGVAGISMGKEIDGYDKYNPGSKTSAKGRMNFAYQFPVITQLQGPKSELSYYAVSDNADSETRYKKALEALSKYKWERALIDIVLDWAYSKQIPAVYLLPANLQKWRPEANGERYRMRYDVSAQRMGFRMQPNGLYGISLLSFPNAVAA